MRLVLYIVPFLKWFHRQRSLVGYSPWRSSVRHDGATNTFTFTFHSLGHSGRSISFRCCCSVAQVCLTLCNPMDCSTPGFLVLHNHLELAQTWVHWVSGAIQSSSPVSPFSSCPQSFPASGSFPMSQFFTSGGQRIEPSTSVLPMNIQDWFPLGLTGLISLQSTGLSRVFSNTNSSEASILQHSAFFMVQLSCSYMTTGKTIALTIQTFVDKLMSLLFNMLSRFVIAFLSRSKHPLISWLHSPSSVMLEPKKIKYHCFHWFPHSLFRGIFPPKDQSCVYCVEADSLPSEPLGKTVCHLVTFGFASWYLCTGVRHLPHE